MKIIVCTIHIGRSMGIGLPTLVAIGGVSVLSVAMTLPMSHIKNKRCKSSVRLTLALVHAVPLLLAAFTITSALRGRCSLWPYVATGVAVAWLVLVLVAVLNFVGDETHRVEVVQGPTWHPEVAPPVLAPMAPPVPPVPSISTPDIADPEPDQRQADLPPAPVLGINAVDEAALEMLLHDYMRSPVTVTFKEDSFGSISSDMGYDD